jgi:Ca2+-binding EF-hand superfamily protein
MKTTVLGAAVLSALMTLATSAPAFAADSGKAGPDLQPRADGSRADVRGRPGRGRPGGAAEFALERLDGNDDGKISREEFLSARLDRVDELLERLDANGDGLLAQGEGREALQERGRPEGRRGRGPGRGGPGPNGGPGAGQGGPAQAAMLACVQKAVPGYTAPERPDAEDLQERFAETDSNKDGKLSLSEVTAAISARATQQFARLDSNGDGAISPTERAAVAEQRQAAAKAMADCMRAQRAR